MGKKKFLAVDGSDQRFKMEDHPAFFGKIIRQPEVVVTDKEMHLHTRVGQFREFTQHAGKAFRDDVLVLVPVIEYIAQEIDREGAILYPVEPTAQLPLRFHGIDVCFGAQVGIGKKIYFFPHDLLRSTYMIATRWGASFTSFLTRATPLRSSSTDPKVDRRSGQGPHG